MKALYSFICACLMLSYSVVRVSAKPATQVISLIEVRNDSEGGILFVFQVDEKISRANLNNGFVKIEGGESFGLHCNQKDETRVQCSTSKKVAGKNVVVGFAGSKFWTYVPEVERYEDYYACFNVYDWDNSFFPTTWVLYGVIHLPCDYPQCPISSLF